MYVRKVFTLENNSLRYSIELAAALCMRRRFFFFFKTAGVFPSHSSKLFIVLPQNIVFLYIIFFIYILFSNIELCVLLHW